MRTPDEETMRSQLPHLQMGKLKDREGKSYSWDENLNPEPRAEDQDVTPAVLALQIHNPCLPSFPGF